MSHLGSPGSVFALHPTAMLLQIPLCLSCMQTFCRQYMLYMSEYVTLWLALWFLASDFFKNYGSPRLNCIVHAMSLKQERQQAQYVQLRLHGCIPGLRSGFPQHVRHSCCPW